MNHADTDLAAEKRRARSAAMLVRAEAHDELQVLAPVTLARLGLEFAGIARGSIVSGFYPHRSEIDTRPLLARLASEGCITSLPVVIGKGERLAFHAWTPGDPIVRGIWDIPVPLPDAVVVEPDVLLVPMLAFDAGGFRLGYGGGYYDRTLRELRQKKSVVAVGVAYSAQEVIATPHGPQDAPLDYILTEKGYRICG